ncbi:ricin-type beta-trefoil lectin domain protein [Catenulispora sp. NF23]|uniref:ricin-type beta-trefoil lectin domain protein n=1 Tax=Catenulispora pinistramenti TaxID=2705254 RepID=UPI001BA89D59|nr:ricin-type beta-trefoil lectin domain protein [Catenulispora pinistramenti]MBS2531647.1 ricin-type beta-trefoil lectin domain protein [Catenulispora pinistramenti]
MADAVAQAKATNEPVVVDQESSEYSTLTAEPDGSFTESQGLAPQRVKQNGAWTPIDTTLTTNPDGTAQPKASVATIRISSGGTVPLATVDDHAGHVLTLTWPGVLPTPTLSGATATFANVYPDVDLAVTATPDSVSDVLIVKNAAAAANPALKTVHLGMSATGLTLTTPDSGAIVLSDASGNPLYGSGTPQMWDSSNPSPPTPSATKSTSTESATATDGAEDPASVAMPAHKSGDGIDLTPDMTLLTGANTVYPVYLDPTVTVASQHHAEIRECNDGNQNTTAFYDMPDSGSFGNGDVVRMGAQPGCKTSASGMARVYALLQFDTSFLYNNRALIINWANLNLTRQYPRPPTAQSSCATTGMWAIGPFGPGATWANSGAASGNNLFGSNSYEVDTGYCGSGNAGFTLNDTAQLHNLYNTSNDPGDWNTIKAPTVTIALKPFYQDTQAHEGWQTFCVSHLYYNPTTGHDICQNEHTDASLSVNFFTEPWEASVTASNAPVGIRGAQTSICGTPTQPGYLPAGNNIITLNGQIADFEGSRNLSYEYALTPTTANGDDAGTSIPIPGGTSNIATGPNQGYSAFPRGTSSTTISLPAATLDQTNPMQQLQDGQEYDLWIYTLDNDPAINAAYNSVQGSTGWDQIEFQKCYFKYAKTAPTQPQFNSGSTFLPTGTPASKYPGNAYPKAGIADGSIAVSATAANTPIDHFDYAINNSSVNIGLAANGSSSCSPVDACGRINVPRATGTVNTTIPIKADTQQGGTNYLYVTAVDAAGNVSWFGEYDYFLAASYRGTVFGDITGDGIPDIMALLQGTDGHYHLKTLPANTDPSIAAGNWVEAAADGAAPAANFQSPGNNPNWDNALFTHMGADRVQPVDDMFAWQKDPSGNGHLYYYFNTAKAGQTLPTDAFSQVQKGTVTRPQCSVSCPPGYDPTSWNNVKQIAAIGPVAGGCDPAAPTIVCETNLVTVEDDGHGGPAQMFLFAHAGIGQLRSPQLIGPADGSIDWATAKLIAPGPAGKNALPDLWVLDNSGTLWRYANQPGYPNALGNSSTRTIIGQPHQFSSFQAVALAGDVNGDGIPDAYGITSNGQLQLFLGSGSGANFTLAPAGSYGTGTVLPLSGTGFTASATTANSKIGAINGATVSTGATGPLVWDVSSGSTQYCLDDLNGNTTNDTSVVDIYQCNGSGPQQWTFNSDGTISPALATTKCLDTGGASQNAGTTLTPNMSGAHIAFHDCDTVHRSGNQIWQVLSNPTNAVSSGESLYNPGSGLCLDDTGYSTTNQTQFQLWNCGPGDTAQIFTPPSVPGTAVTTEAESIWSPSTSNGSAAIQGNCCGVAWSNNAQWFFTSTTAQSTMTLNYYVPAAGTYRIVPSMTVAPDYGKVALTIDNSNTSLPATFDSWQASKVSTTSFQFGVADLTAGMHSFTFTLVGTNPSSTGNRYNMGIDVLSLIPTTSTGPEPALALSVASGSAPLAVAADATASLPGVAAISSYTFDFGDGTVVGPQSTPTAQHTYTNPAATSVVKVTETDSVGGSATMSRQVTTILPAPTSLTSNDGSATTACSTDPAHPVIVSSLTPVLAATATGPAGASMHAEFEMSDVTSGAATPPLIYGRPGSASAVGTAVSVTTPTLTSGHLYAWAARAGDSNGNLSATTPQCYVQVGATAATADGTSGLLFDNATYPANPGQSWSGPLSNLVWQSDGNLVLYSKAGKPLWASNTAGNPGAVLVPQNDGNLVIYASQPSISVTGHVSGSVLWATNTNNSGAWHLVVRADGNMVIDSGTGIAYTSNTYVGNPAIAGALISTVPTSGNSSRQVCVDDLDGNTTNGTSVIGVYDCNHGWTQAWQFGSDGTIRAMGQNSATPSTKCLDTGGVNTQGSQATMYDCQPGNVNQVWQVILSTSAPGQISLKNPNSGLCLDDTNGSTANRNPFQLYGCLDNANQHFLAPTGAAETQGAEGESLWGSTTGGSMLVQTNCCNESWSNGAQQQFINTAAGNSMTLNYYVANPGTYLIAPVMTKSADYGTVQLSIGGGTALPNTFDGYNSTVTTQQYAFGKATLTAGMHSFTFTVNGTNPASVNNRYEAGVDVFALLPTLG